MYKMPKPEVSSAMAVMAGRKAASVFSRGRRGAYYKIGITGEYRPDGFFLNIPQVRPSLLVYPLPYGGIKKLGHISHNHKVKSARSSVESSISGMSLTFFFLNLNGIDHAVPHDIFILFDNR